MSAEDFLVDATTRHQIFVQRFAGGQVKEMLGYLRDLVFQVEIKLAEASTLSQAQKLGINLREIRELIDEGLEAASGNLLANTADFAEYEAQFAVKTLNAASTVEAVLPESRILQAIVTNQPMELVTDKATQRLTMSEAISGFNRKKSAEITRTIQNGYVNGDTTENISRSVRNLTKRQARQADALVRTTVNHISSQARATTHKDNADILTGEMFEATLDSRTTIGCAALDGKIFGFNEPVFTPRHWNCRSQRIPVVNPKYAQPSLSGKRAAEGGPVSGGTKYSSWIKRQPKAFQQEVLGADRTELLRKGGLSIDKFSDPVGRTYTLDELRTLEPMAFEQAGLE